MTVPTLVDVVPNEVNSRIVEVRRTRFGDIAPLPLNPKSHPEFSSEVVMLHPFAVSGQSLCWAFMYRAYYTTLRGWEPSKPIDETLYDV